LRRAVGWDRSLWVIRFTALRRDDILGVGGGGGCGDFWFCCYFLFIVVGVFWFGLVWFGLV